jgi:hypothetical protein
MTLAFFSGLCPGSPWSIPAMTTEDEAFREAVGVLKALANLRSPAYELPADSFLERAVRKIWDLRDQATKPSGAGMGRPGGGGAGSGPDGTSGCAPIWSIGVKKDF